MSDQKIPPCPFTAKDLRVWKYASMLHYDDLANAANLNFGDLMRLWLADALDKIKGLEKAK